VFPEREGERGQVWLGNILGVTGHTCDLKCRSRNFSIPSKGRMLGLEILNLINSNFIVFLV
jgi:hypothetical protein